MSEFLGNTYKTGDTAPEAGVYQLLKDDPNVDERTDMGRVFRFNKGDVLPGHPDTSAPAEWRYMRVKEAAPNDVLQN
jgi:hypothetical protein